ncbi:MAG: hypothetical protein OXT65_12425 [Alphaproteobacteria bacterium]|nr:hypothetical protein [Alphaproteobacteria bacterium]
MAKKTEKNLKRFYAGLALPVMLFLAYVLVSAELLHRAGEYMPMPDIVTHIEDTGGVYGSALNATTYWFKKAVYEHYTPDVAALGSSRVLLFRPEAFSVPFANLGSMHNLDEVIEMAHAVFPAQPPQVLILGLDFWWFLPSAETDSISRSAERPDMTLRDLFMPPRWLFRGKMRWDDVSRILYRATPDLGISGITRKDGFESHGSYYYTSTYTGRLPAFDRHFDASLARIKNGDKYYEHGSNISQVQIEKLRKLVRFLKSLDIHVLLFIPPLAPTPAKVLREQELHTYIKQLHISLVQLSHAERAPLFTYHDVLKTGTTDCEFIDSIHGGETVYYRMLEDMAQRNSLLGSMVREDVVAENIAAHAGRVSDDPAETDFLDIGCKKDMPL